MASPKFRVPIQELLWRRVRKTETCWNWTGKTRNGYGRLHRYEGDQILWVSAHRLSYELAHGPIPAGLLVLHSCDNPACVRPDHLTLGTQAENIADAVAKGHRAFGRRNGKHTRPEKTPRGEANGISKLTASQVVEMRRRYESGGVTQRALAREYGVVKTAVANILHRKTWTHI